MVVKQEGEFHQRGLLFVFQLGEVFVETVAFQHCAISKFGSQRIASEGTAFGRIDHYIGLFDACGVHFFCQCATGFARGFGI